MCAVLVHACTQHALVLPSLPQRTTANSSWLLANICRQGKAAVSHKMTGSTWLATIVVVQMGGGSVNPSYQVGGANPFHQVGRASLPHRTCSTFCWTIWFITFREVSRWLSPWRPGCAILGLTSTQNTCRSFGKHMFCDRGGATSHHAPQYKQAASTRPQCTASNAVGLCRHQ